MEGWLSPGPGRGVRRALRRWRDRGLISGELAEDLSRETDAWERRARRRFGRAVVAVTGGVLLLIAVGVFLVRAWPELGPEARTGILAVLAVALHGLGSFLVGRDPESTTARVLQASGLAVLLAAFVHSEEAWADGSPGGLVVGVSALAIPVGLLPGSLRAGPVPASLVTALGYGYLTVFLDRALSLGPDLTIWVLDGVAVLSILFLLARLRRPASGEPPGWAVALLLVSLYAGLVLIFFTGTVALELEHSAVWPLDAWLGLIAGATLWGIHRAPPRLRRAWYPRNLAGTVVLAIPLCFWTFEGASPWAAGGALGGVGVVGLAYGLRTEAGHVTLASSLVLVVAAWFLGAEAGQATGLAVGLAFAAALLFWVSSRVGGGGTTP